MPLSSDQAKSLDDILMFLTHPYDKEMVLSGSAGTGKTFLVKYLLQEAQKQVQFMKMIMNDNRDLNYYLTSTTNKAAEVLGRATGMPVQTIHKALGLIVYDDPITGEPVLRRGKKPQIIENALILVDEASMCNRELFKYIRDSSLKCKILYIGDPYQLTPVKEPISPVFTDISNTTKLTQIQRQAEDSPIIQFAQGFRNAQDTEIFPIVKANKPVIEYLNQAEFSKAIRTEFLNMPHGDYARIVAWSNNRIHTYNNYIRKLNGAPTAYIPGEYVIANSPIHNDKQIVVANNAVVEIANVIPGEKYKLPGWHITLTGGIESFQPESPRQLKLLLDTIANAIKSKDPTALYRWIDFFEIRDSFCDLRPAYANTINKAQGSTYTNVFIDLHDIGKNTQDQQIAKLVYTAVTRASERVFLYGRLPERLYDTTRKVKT